MSRRWRLIVAGLVITGAASSCSTLVGIEELAHYHPSDGGAGAAGDATPDASAGGSSMGGSGSSSGGAAGSVAQAGSGGQSGSTANDGGGDAATNDPASACADLAAQTCATFEKCTFLLKIIYGTKPVCLDREQKSCMAQLAAPGTGLTPALVRACTTERKGEGCVNYVPSPSCVPLGKLADGADCWTAAQCAGGSCRIPFGASCGKCSKKSALNEACYSPLDCLGGLDTWCRGPTPMQPGVCTAAAGLGSNCSGAAQIFCRSDLWCQGGTCSNAAKPVLGEACSPLETQCDAIQGFTCDPVATKCRALVVAAANQPCPDYICEAAGQCVNASMPNSMCLPAAKDGTACDDAIGQRCLAPAFCKNHVCVLPDQRCN